MIRSPYQCGPAVGDVCIGLQVGAKFSEKSRNFFFKRKNQDQIMHANVRESWPADPAHNVDDSSGPKKNNHEKSSLKKKNANSCARSQEKVVDQSSTKKVEHAQLPRCTGANTKDERIVST